MPVTVIRFLSRNPYKLQEAQRILEFANVTIRPVNSTIEELQTENVDHLIRDKALKAFKKVGRPVFVEHTGLYLAQLGGLPGGLTQIFWDRLLADRFAEMFGTGSNTDVEAKTVIGYIDGRQLHMFSGSIRGRIASEPRGPRGFQWDCVFIPDGERETFAEMGARKDDISMRRRALDQLATHLAGHHRIT